MQATMTKDERALYEKRPFKAYDRDGNAVYFKHAVDMRQGMEMHGLTVNPPGEPQPESGNPFKDYEAKSTETIRELCIARNVAGYMLMEKSEQIAALRALDKRDEELRTAGIKAAEPPKKGK